MTSNQIGELIALRDAGDVGSSAADTIFEAMCDSDEAPRAIAESLNLRQVSDAGALDEWIDAALEAQPQAAEDFAGGKDAAARNGDLYATWLQQSGPGTYAYDIGMARSTDRGETWTMLGTLNDDRVLGEHGFVSMVPEGDGVRAVWLDGRSMTGEGHDGHGGGDMSLRTTTINPTIDPSKVIDERTCECCPTTMARTASGPVVLYRDRHADERRDVSIVGLTDDRWSQPRDVHRDNWEIAGCPVNGPSVAADADFVAAAWYTGGASPGVRVAMSRDGGATWDAPVPVGSEDATGRPDICLHEGRVHVCWIDQDEDASVLLWTHLRADGSPAPPKRIGPVAAGRRSGYPRLAPVGKAVLAVWVAESPSEGLSSQPLRILLSES